MKYFIILILLIPLNVYAETYLCLAETGTGVENTGKGGFKSEVYDVSNQKFILNNNSGSWLLRRVGENNPLFDNCISEYMCMMKVGYSGIFLRSNDGVFTLSLIQAYGSDFKKSIILTVKGLCSKL